MRCEEERRRAALAEHPGAEYVGGGLVRLPDGRVARSSAAVTNDELRRANVLANDAAVKALLSRGRSLASLIDDDGVVDEHLADDRRRENLDALAEMAAELRREERARKTGTGPAERS